MWVRVLPAPLIFMKGYIMIIQIVLVSIILGGLGFYFIDKYDKIKKENAALKQDYHDVMILLDRMTEIERYDGCRYDHDGLCQTHALHERPCPYNLAIQKVDVYFKKNGK